MIIQSDSERYELVQPGLAIRELENVFKLHWEGDPAPVEIVKRPVRASDPNLTIGFSQADWVPNESNLGQFEPLLSTYLLHIQAFVKHGVEEDGIAMHALFTKNLRSMLYRSASLRIRLGGLSETSMGVRETVKKWGIRQTRYLSNDLTGTFTYVSTTDFFIQTESIEV